MSTKPQRRHAVVSGRVQAVGFRASAQITADELGVVGWICNLPDGHVEIEFEGSRTAIEAMERWLHRGPRFARVAAVEAHDVPSLGAQAESHLEVRG